MNPAKNIVFITEENKMRLNLSQNEKDMVYYSELNEWDSPNAYRNFSIKYLIEGFTDYKTSEREFRLTSNSLLFATKQPGVTGSFKSAKEVRSICIDLSPDIIAEAYTVLRKKDDVNLDDNFLGYFNHPNFYDRICDLRNSSLSGQVLELLPYLKKGVDFSLDREWFFSLAEKVIVQELGTYVQLNNLKSVKQSTRKEILYRLLNGKTFINENFLCNPGMREIARESRLSEFHFFRSFKQAFGITPYQYMLAKRLEHGCQLIRKKEFTIGEIAIICGFPDLFTFSKAFKRRFNTPPSKYLLCIR